MLPNTLNLPINTGSITTTAPFSLIDVDNGRSVRIYDAGSGSTHTLTIQRQTTTENKPVGTTRTQLRLEHKKVLEDGSERVAFCSIVIATPRSGDFTAAELAGCIRGCFALMSGAVSATTGAYTAWDAGWQPVGAESGDAGSVFLTQVLLPGQV